MSEANADGAQDGMMDDMADEGEYGDQVEDSAEGDDIFKNNHDLIGVQGILRAQKNEIEKKKLELRMANERYFRQHPEINGLLQLFVQKVLDDRPENVLEYAGTFFDSASLRDIVTSYMAKAEAEEQKHKHLSDLIKGKTLIWSITNITALLENDQQLQRERIWIQLDGESIKYSTPNHYDLINKTWFTELQNHSQASHSLSITKFFEVT